MIYSVAAVAMLALWAAGIVFFDAPGWIHILLTAGVAIWMYGVVKPRAAKP